MKLNHAEGMVSILEVGRAWGARESDPRWSEFEDVPVRVKVVSSFSVFNPA